MRNFDYHPRKDFTQVVGPAGIFSTLASPSLDSVSNRDSRSRRARRDIAPSFDSRPRVLKRSCPSLTSFGPAGIEPALHDPQPCVLPLYYGPFWHALQYFVGPPGIEPGLYEPESYVLPVYYGPIKYWK